MTKREVSLQEIYPELALSEHGNCPPNCSECIDIPDVLVRQYDRAYENWQNMQTAVAQWLAANGHKDLAIDFIDE